MPFSPRTQAEYECMFECVSLLLDVTCFFFFFYFSVHPEGFLGISMMLRILFFLHTLR